MVPRDGELPNALSPGALRWEAAGVTPGDSERDGDRDRDSDSGGGEIEVRAGATGYRFQVSRRGRLRQVAFGDGPGVPALRVVDQEGGFPHAHPTYGEDVRGKPALRVTHHDGVTTTRLTVDGHERRRADGGDEHRIRLVDEGEPLDVVLGFRTWEDDDVLEQWVEVTNRQAGPITVHAAAAAAPCLPVTDDGAWLTHFGGGWAAEWGTVEERLRFGAKVLESYGGVQPHLQHNPFFLLSPDGPSTEDGGAVLAGGLAWGGNVRFGFEVASRDVLRMWCGASPVGADHVLDPGTTLVTPRMVWAWSPAGRGPLSRRLHRWVRGHAVRDGERLRPIVVNNWESTFFDFDQAKLLALMDGARDIDAELFLLDDGWFGDEHPRDDDRAGLGDWVVDRRKLPGGLAALTDGAAARDLRFGLWVEPEMVNPRSTLYEQHPDWVVAQPGRERRLGRHQLVLDVCRPEVRRFAADVVGRLLDENPGISYVKWDANRSISEPGTTALPADRQGNFWHDHATATWALMAEVTERHPDVELMLCASGGGRVDLGSLRWFHEVWLSDNTDPVVRVRMQWAAGHFLPANVVGAHVTRWAERPLPFGCAVAMSARFGFDLDLTGLAPDELAVCRRAVAAYRRVRDLVQLGDLWRLISPDQGTGDVAALAYIARDRSRAVVFAYRLPGPGSASVAVPLAGLDPERDYEVRVIDLTRDEPSPSPSPSPSSAAGGSELLRDGLTWEEAEPLTAAIWELT
jgi:alpha-galactosidase